MCVRINVVIILYSSFSLQLVQSTTLPVHLHQCRVENFVEMDWCPRYFEISNGIDRFRCVACRSITSAVVRTSTAASPILKTFDSNPPMRRNGNLRNNLRNLYRIVKEFKGDLEIIKPRTDLLETISNTVAQGGKMQRGAFNAFGTR